MDILYIEDKIVGECTKLYFFGAMGFCNSCFYVFFFYRDLDAKGLCLRFASLAYKMNHNLSAQNERIYKSLIYIYIYIQKNIPYNPPSR